MLLPNFLDSVFWDVMLRWMMLPILLAITVPSSLGSCSPRLLDVEDESTTIL
jgi:hypothetical protein